MNQKILSEKANFEDKKKEIKKLEQDYMDKLG